MEIRLVLAGLFPLTGFSILLMVHSILQSLWWKITGVESKIKASLAAPLPKKKVQVLRIIRKNIHPSSIIPPRPSAFLCWHEDLYPMEYLMKPNVSFFTMTGPGEVIFLETTPGVELFNLRENPFTFVAQAKHAIKMIKVHSSDLIAYAESLKEPGVNVVWILHSARCGSTALAQCLGSLPNWKALSEIYWVFRGLPTPYESKEHIEGYLRSKQFHSLAKACLKVQLLHFPDDGNFCWKVSGCGEAYVLPIIAKEFPKHKIIYALRNGQDTAKSIYRIFNRSPIMPKMLEFINKNPTILQKSDFLSYYRAAFTNGWMTDSVLDFWMDKRITLFEFVYCAWVTNIVTLKEFGSDIPMLIIEHDFYRKDLSTNIKTVLNYIGAMTPDNLELALKSYDTDSQADSVISQESLKTATKWTRHEPTVEKSNKLAASFNLPSFDERLTVKNFKADKWTFIMDLK